MNLNLFFISFVLIIISFVNQSVIGSPDSLKLIEIVQRHGDRNPTNFYTNDIYKDPAYWEDGIGELTRDGKTRMFEFGITIRQKYGDYLQDFSPRNVNVRSSGLSRTLESAQAFMAGLYPPKGFWIWDNDTSFGHQWQPIAINTVLASTDGMLRTSANCPKADRLWNEFMQTKEVTLYLKQNEQFIKDLSKHTGDQYWNVKPSPLRPLEFLSTTLRVEGKEKGLQLPEWATNETLEKLRELEIHAFYFDWKSPEIQRLRAGLLLQELVNNMVNRADVILNQSKKDVKKLYVYETHDVNQVVLMQALGIYDLPAVNRTPPKYTASLVFELHQMDNNTDFIVNLLYFNDIKLRNSSVDDFVELPINICDPNPNNCTLKKLIESVENLIPSNWESECNLLTTQVSQSDSNSDSDSYMYFNLFSLVYILCGFLLALIPLLLYRFINRKNDVTQIEERNALDASYSKKYNE